MTSEKEREALSALLDGEASELECRRILRDIGHEEKAGFSRWQLARDIMQGHESAPVSPDFAASVGSQLSPRNRPAWLAGASRMAVAASVAAATVVGWQFWNAGAGGPQSLESVATAAQESRLNRPVGETAMVAVGAPSRSGQPVAEQRRLKDMVLRHNDLTARHSNQGVTPYARLVSLEGRR
jgi:sigma-E factor negative regulatory protein RseA